MSILLKVVAHGSRLLGYRFINILDLLANGVETSVLVGMERMVGEKKDALRCGGSIKVGRPLVLI